jgi:hypothetical protein
MIKNIMILLVIIFIIIAIINIIMAKDFSAACGWICALVWCGNTLIFSKGFKHIDN